MGSFYLPLTKPLLPLPPMCSFPLQVYIPSSAQQQVSSLGFESQRNLPPIPMKTTPRFYPISVAKSLPRRKTASFYLRCLLCCQPRSSSQRIHKPPVTGYPSLVLSLHIQNPWFIEILIWVLIFFQLVLFCFYIFTAFFIIIFLFELI